MDISESMRLNGRLGRLLRALCLGSRRLGFGDEDDVELQKLELLVLREPALARFCRIFHVREVLHSLLVPSR